eukprot:9180375-Heterocapsa_arctica.AAC.1
MYVCKRSANGPPRPFPGAAIQAHGRPAQRAADHAAPAPLARRAAAIRENRPLEIAQRRQRGLGQPGFCAP